MTEYNAQDLQSTLNYIKKRFGMEAFVIPGRIVGLFSDLAPSLEADRAMIERMSRRGILEGFVNADGLSEREKNTVVAKMLTVLTDNEFIRPEVAVRYVSTFVNVFEWKIEVSLPRERNKESFQFDSQRYLKEIKDEIYQQADHAFANEDYLKALTLFNKANELGNIQAGVRLGQMYWNGDGCEIDHEKAIRLFIVGVSEGNPLANEWMVEAYRLGRGVPEDCEKAETMSRFGRKALEEMCALKDPDAMYMQGWNCLNSPYYSKDETLGYSLLTSAAERGHIKAKVQTALCLLEGKGCIKDIKNGLQILAELANTSNNSYVHYILGKLYYLGETVKRDYEKARIYFESAADKNNKFAPRYLGDIYFLGEGVNADYVAARTWYLKAFDYGDIKAARHLGYIYYNGNGIDKDYKKAFSYFKYAADKGDARSQYMLHYFFFFMDQFKDYQAGSEYLEKAAEAGDDLAQTALAKYLLGAYGLNKNKQAVRPEGIIYWLEKAAEQENAEAEYFLGVIIVPTDEKKAVYWLEKAAEQNYTAALIDLAKFYYEGKCVEKNDQIVLSYAQKAEENLREEETQEIRQPILWFKLAECYEELKYTKNAADCFWRAFRDGNGDALQKVGWYTLIQKCESQYRTMNDLELLNCIEKEAESSENAFLPFVVGMFYYSKPNLYLGEYWLNISSEKGYVPAMEYLASFYCDGWNYTRGFEMAEKAFDLGSAEGARLLGMCYKLGQGTKKNKRKAKEFLKIAVERGSDEAAKDLKKFLF